MQNCMFIGRLAQEVYFGETKENEVFAGCKLIENNYAGKDDNDEAIFKSNCLDFVAFKSNVVNALKHFGKGDQLIVKFEVRQGTDDRDYKPIFIIKEIEFGAKAQ